jgi:hypothetical protein
MDPTVRRQMTREKTDTILKVLVKHFFIEKEVTSTLVMDSLYSGLKALEYQSKNKKGVPKLTETDVRSTSMVLVEQDMFVLADDVLLLLERATLDTLPHQPLPAKDEKSSQNRTKVCIFLVCQFVKLAYQCDIHPLYVDSFGYLLFHFGSTVKYEASCHTIHLLHKQKI